MRRAFRASRLVASVVATFLYLAFEEAVRARAERAAETHSALGARDGYDETTALSVHERPTLPGTVEAPIRDLVRMSPVIRVIESPEGERRRSEGAIEPQRVTTDRPAVLFGVEEDAIEAPDVATLLSTLRRDVGCRAKKDATHQACSAARTLADFVDRDAVLEALEETVTAADRPGCVSVAGVSSLGRSSRAAARAALTRMLSVARGRADWTGRRSDRDLVALLLHTLDVAG
jgi:hypothetical protein